MLRITVTFFVLGLISILSGAYGAMGLSIQAGKILFIIFIVLAVLSFLIGILKEGSGKRIH